MQSNLQWKKAECQLPKIRKTFVRLKSDGQVDIVVGMFLFIVLVVTILFGFRTTQYMVTAACVEDALAASNLASAVIDLEEYGKTHMIRIPEVEPAFWSYREALCRNLGLDENLNTTNKELISSQVEIKEYIVYNVQGEAVETYCLDGTGKLQSQWSGKKGEVFTPDNVCVETTTIYSRIGFWVEGLMGQEIYAEKENSIDITRCDSE